MDRESVEDVSSIQRAQDFSSMDQPIYWEVIKVKPWNFDRKGIYQDSIEKLLRIKKRGFLKGENT